MNIRFAKKSDMALLARQDRHIAREEMERIIPLNRILLAEEKDQFAGWLRYSLFWDNTPFLNLLYVLEDFRGRGLGRQLVQFWEQEMVRQGYRTLMTSTQANEYAQHFYFRLGYEAVGGFRLGEEPYEVIFARQMGERA